MKKEFDFTKARQLNQCPQKIDWFEKYHNQKISEEFFVKEMREKIKPFSKAKHKAHQYSFEKISCAH